MPYHVQELSGSESVALLKALASETRARILELLGGGNMNINELSAALGIAQPSVTKHIQVLEEVGLVSSDYSAGAQGMQKRCHRIHDRIVLDFDRANRTQESVSEIEMPIGLYTSVAPVPTCGLASREKFIGHLDDPLAFHFPDRAKAEVIWSSGGFVEYTFPNSLPAPTTITGVDVAMEIGSEAPGFNNEYPSDITLWINDVEIGTWQSPGDMGGIRGRLNPAWWHDYLNQYGFFKVWSVTTEGSFIDGMRLSDVTLGQLDIRPWQATRVRIGIKPDAPNQGGFTILGRGFGNYEQDLILRLHHSTKGGDVPLPLKKSYTTTSPDQP